MENEHKIFEFLNNPDRETFLKCRALVTHDPGYDPYSEDTDHLRNLLNEGKFEEVVRYTNINTLLSPGAHIYKYFAYKELGDEKGRSIEMLMARALFECIEKTGDGTEDAPYLVTRISDERELVRHHLEKQDVSQRLINNGDRMMDVLYLEDGSEIYFDITIPYRRMAYSFSKKKEDISGKKETQPRKKKWWDIFK